MVRWVVVTVGKRVTRTVCTLLLLGQQPRFVLDEAKRAWDYIVAGFPTEALTTRAH